jgi:NTP pyrophosphatase (non-canonical NTP hydrolase)
MSFQQTQFPGDASAKIARTSLALGVLVPAPLHIGSNPGIELIVVGSDHVHPPGFFTHRFNPVHMPQQSLDLTAISRAFRTLADAKGWEAYHRPKNLAAAVAVEAAELLEIFQWLSDEEAEAIARDPHSKQKVGDEVADVLMYLLELCQRLDIDMAEAVAQKIAHNRAREGLD